MVDVAGVRAIGDPGVEWAMRSQQPYDDPKRRLDQMVPLLHELIAFDLVQRADDGSFVLRQDVQERLAALTADRPYRSAEVFVGRKCQVCECVKLTRMVDGVRVCSTCSRAALDPATVDDPALVTGKVPRGFFHRHRRAS
jgi:hypothetical protein